MQIIKSESANFSLLFEMLMYVNVMYKLAIRQPARSIGLNRERERENIF